MSLQLKQNCKKESKLYNKKVSNNKKLKKSEEITTSVLDPNIKPKMIRRI